MSEFKSHYLPAKITDNAKLLVFLHGYNNTYDEMLPIYNYLQQIAPDLTIVAPEGNSESQEYKGRKRWYKVSGFDVDGKRQKNSTSVEEIMKIYNVTGAFLHDIATHMNHFIDDVQQQYGFKNDNTFIAGFSQGAMLSIWTALTRKHKLAGCCALSGLISGIDELQKSIVSHPNVYLMHGTADTQVLFKCMDFTKNWLINNNVPVQIKAFENMGHIVSHEELDCLVDFLCR